MTERWQKYYYRHREFHLKRNREYYLNRMAQWWEWFAELGQNKCQECGYNRHPKALDWHHRDPKDKVIDIGKFINGRQCNEANKTVLLEEIEKCDRLCACCHRIRHFDIANEKHTYKG